MCQHALARALEHRDALRALGGDLVVLHPSRPDTRTLRARRAELPADLRIACDPDAILYDALGTIRGELVDQLRHQLGSLWRARADVRKWRLTRSDMLRMGADVAVGPDGTIALKHICTGPEDRADPRAVLAALEPVSAPT